MRNAVKSEIRKILATPSLWGLLALGLGLEVVSSMVGMAASKGSEFPARFDELPFLHFGATNLCLLFVILGIRALGDEFAYDTITPTLDVDPNRPRLIVAKAVTYGGAAALFTVVTLAILVPASIAVVHARHLGLAVSAGPITAAAVGSLGAAVLWAVIGVALGSIVRHRVPVLVGTILWLAFVESALQGALHANARFLPGQLTAALTQADESGPHLLGPLVALAVMVAIAGALLAAGMASLRRDISG